MIEKAATGERAAPDGASAADGLPPEAEISLDEVLSGVAAGSVRVVDVRAPREFEEDRIPGAENLPLFDDRERAVVGTLFRHLGAGAARTWGRETVERRLEPFVARLRAALSLPEEPGAADAAPTIPVICCARGGERSAAVTRLLRDRGHAVRRLTGGYRSYRTWVREHLHSIEVENPVLLDGLTGCGKTAVLRAVEDLRPGSTIDLEGLAGHRSSLLGDIGLETASQKRFESGLLRDVARLRGPWTLIEAESRRIGDREIPAALFAAMRRAPRIELVATEEQRIAHLREDYLGSGTIADVAERIGALSVYPRIGAEGVTRMREQLDRGEVDPVVRTLLAEHYDPRYRHGNETIVPVTRVEREEIGATAARIVILLDRLAGTDRGGPRETPAR